MVDAAPSAPATGGLTPPAAAREPFKVPTEIFPVIAVMSSTAMMVVPIPAALLDFLLTMSLTLSIAMLITTIYTRNPLEFSVFPTLLLMVTLMRLSLNVCSTRLILLNGYAGALIEAFGQFVVGANYVVGFVMFAILAVIQFVVITHGAQRVAEVAARFTLDSLPGKQMAIDSDLAAGLLTEEQARQRRIDLQRQTDFYGSMDGSSKFVRGDAIAAVVILVVNIVGGLIVGVLQHDLPLAEAAQRYTLLTVGEGLAAQFPALLVSTAAGLMVTRSATTTDLGEDMATQMALNPAALRIIAATLGLFALVPGVPKLPLALMAGALLYYAQRVSKRKAAPPVEAAAPAEQAATGEPEDVSPLLELEAMEMEIGYSLVGLVKGGRGNDLLNKVLGVRRACAMELGLIVPPIRIRDSFEARPNEYIIKIYGTPVATGEVMVKRLLALNYLAADEDIEGIETKEPAYGMPALWISENQKEEAEALGCTVIDPATMIATHLSEVIKAKASSLLGLQEVQALLDRVKTQVPALVDYLVPNRLTVGEVHRVLQNLLAERVSIRNLRLILETLAAWSPQSRDLTFLTEQVRVALGRSICAKYRQPNGNLYCVTLDITVETMLRDASVSAERPQHIDPIRLRDMYASLTKALEKLTNQGFPAVVLCSAEARPVFRHLVDRVAPGLVVLSYREIVSDQPVVTVDSVSLAAPAGAQL
ncbi:MAG: flagellar biosynthesis protein FlhA [Proteobacteria bacterium]|nr:flagellar biosynthesis protein FlhA [Pseudomonadota bacterium]